jgi:hypothetical protein
MNKNLFIYSFKYLAVLLALVTFSSCERDEFTEQDAFDLQQAQLDAQAAREEAALAAGDKRIMDMAMFRRSMDSLARLNSGGKVFYTVNVVPGGSSAFASGRFEEVEGLDGATVTVSQLGGAIVEQKVTVAGLATFEMYSGEVTVNVEAPNHTDLNYTANLTPDGGVSNGSIIYVGNVVPVFDDPNNPGAGSEENLATVKGFAFAELDLTFGNNFEESVPDETKVRAFIDVNNPDFRTRYIDQANGEEGENIGTTPTASGFIQRFAYEEAASTTGATVTSPLNNDTAPEGGEYSITIGATASGLPITMKFDDFAADRTYAFGGEVVLFDFENPDGDFGTGSKRFIYTQNTQNAANTAFGAATGGANQNPSFIPAIGAFNFAPLFSSVAFDFATTEAAATVSVTGGTSIETVTGPAVVIDGISYDQYLRTDLSDPALLDIVSNDVDDAYVGDGNRGSYISTPTVVFPMPTDATGVRATGVAIMGNRNEAESPINTSDGNLITPSNDLRPVVSILVTNEGSGYVDSPATTTDDIEVSFVRYSYTGTDAASLPIPNGYGTVQAPSSSITYVEIIDGGYGMTTPISLTVGGAYTGIPPTVLFNNLGDAAGVAPAGGIGATAVAVVDGSIGTVTEVQVIDGGDGYSDPDVTFIYGEGSQIILSAPTTAVFETDGAGGLRFADDTNINVLDLVGTEGDIQLTLGSRPYTFVPGVQVQVAAPIATQIPPTLAATVNAAGFVISIRITDPGAGFGAAAGDPVPGLTLLINPKNVGVDADAYTEGTGIDNYVIQNYGIPSSAYKSIITGSSIAGTFNYLTTDGAEIVSQNSVLVFDAVDAQIEDPSLYSDYIIYFAPSSTGSQAVGYPIFDNDGQNLVGIKITTQGANYAANEEHPFWVVPNGISLNEYASEATTTTNNSFVTAGLAPLTLTITFADGNRGLGYAVRPTFTLFGGNKSVEDLALINAGPGSISNFVRPQLTFNGAGTITNTIPITYDFAGTGLTFSAADLAADPLFLQASVVGLQRTFSALANVNLGTGAGRVEPTTNNVTDYTGAFTYRTGVTGGPSAPNTATAAFNEIEGLIGAFVTYITAPTYTVTFAGVATGGEGVGVLSAATADLVGLSPTAGATGSLPTSFGLTSFIDFGNDPSYDENGERFRTIGGPSNFSVFSGLTYIRDVNYGTGIELE